MAGKRKKKKGLIVLIVVLVILVAAIWAGKTFVYDKAKEKVTSAVAENMCRMTPQASCKTHRIFIIP